MLRYYEKCGLFTPAEIEYSTGYRYYSASQISLLSRVTALRDMGFSVEEIAAALPLFDDASAIRRLLDSKAEQIRGNISSEQSKLERIAAFSGTLNKERVNMLFDVEIKSLPPVKVLTLRGKIPHYRDEGILWEKLGSYMGKNAIEGADVGYSTYFDNEYQESNPDVEIAIPVEVPGKSDGEFIYKEYAEMPLAATVRFSGPLDGGYDAAIEKLAQWIEKNGYTMDGFLRGHTIVAPDADKNPDNWLTEIQVPVKKA